MAKKADIGIVGLGVMGQSLALNMERNGFSVAGFDLYFGILGYLGVKHRVHSALKRRNYFTTGDALRSKGLVLMAREKR